MGNNGHRKARQYMNNSKTNEFMQQQPEKYEWCKRPFLKGGAIGLLLGNAVGLIVSINSVVGKYESPLNIEIILAFSGVGIIVGLFIGKYISNQRFSVAIDKMHTNPENEV
jgi:hypothetical protein